MQLYNFTHFSLTFGLFLRYPIELLILFNKEELAIKNNRSNWSFILIVMIISLLARSFSAFSQTPPWGAWSKNVKSSKKGSSFARFLFRQYQLQFSDEDGAKCPFYPTCSAYALQALEKHGVVYGSLLTLDRLFSEYPGMPRSGNYPLITKHDVHRPYDPVP